MKNIEIFRNIFRFIILILIQVLLLNQINFLGYINPYLYILFIIIFPFMGNKSLLILLSFILGLFIDMFGDSGGVHAAACVFIAYIRPVILKFSFGVSYEYNSVKINKVGFNQRILYISLLVLIHHLLLFSLESEFLSQTSHLLVQLMMISSPLVL